MNDNGIHNIDGCNNALAWNTIININILTQYFNTESDQKANTVKPNYPNQLQTRRREVCVQTKCIKSQIKNIIIIS